MQIEDDHRQRIAGEHLLNLASHVADLRGVSGGRRWLGADTEDGIDVCDLDGEIGQPGNVAGALNIQQYGCKYIWFFKVFDKSTVELKEVIVSPSCCRVWFFDMIDGWMWIHVLLYAESQTTSRTAGVLFQPGLQT